MNLSLGIDVGTSGVRTAVIDEAGRVIATARADHVPQDRDHVDAELWWQAVVACIERQVAALKEIGRSGQHIARIAVDGTSGTMLLVDQTLRPVAGALMYNSGGFEEEADLIAHHAPQNHIARGSQSALARAMRLVGQDTDKQGRYLLHQADFVMARLMERGGMSDHNNALKTGFDPESECWPEWIGGVIDQDLLPKVQPAGEEQDHISPRAASDLGLSPRTIVHAGTTDSIAAFLASAPIEAGVAVTSLGSTLAIKVLSQNRIDDPEIGLYAHRVADNWLVGGASNTGGAVLAFYFSKDQLQSISAKIDPQQPSEFDYYPLLRPGERFPFNDPHLAPQLTPRPGSDADFLHGLLESIANIEAMCYRAIEARGGDFPSKIFTAGGGAKNATWTAIRARVLGIEPKESLETEAAVGTARLTRLSESLSRSRLHGSAI